MPYKPGQWVPQSGIYNVVHDDQHHQTHQVTCVEHKRFPPCRQCRDGVRFELAKAAIHVEDHSSFD